MCLFRVLVNILIRSILIRLYVDSMHKRILQDSFSVNDNYARLYIYQHIYNKFRKQWNDKRKILPDIRSTFERFLLLLHKK